MAKTSNRSPEEKLRVVLSVLRGEVSAAAAGRLCGVLGRAGAGAWALGAGARRRGCLWAAGAAGVQQLWCCGLPVEQAQYPCSRGAHEPGGCVP